MSDARITNLEGRNNPERNARRRGCTPTARACLAVLAMVGWLAATASDQLADCGIGLGTPRPGPAAAAPAALDPGRIAVLSWNIKKGAEAGWRTDLHRLAAGKDLVLLQEARLTPAFLGAVDGMASRPAARGWKNSGVLTAARAALLARCSSQHIEPLLGTPKAALLTEYALRGTASTLLVVNVHVVNFALGLSEFREQIGDLHAVMSRHPGPIIFSGDFNTWRASRLAALRATVDRLGLEPVRFAEDRRTRKFGHALDHIFVRGLHPVTARVERVGTSDHNPLITVLAAAGEIADHGPSQTASASEI